MAENSLVEQNETPPQSDPTLEPKGREEVGLFERVRRFFVTKNGTPSIIPIPTPQIPKEETLVPEKPIEEIRVITLETTPVEKPVVQTNFPQPEKPKVEKKKKSKKEKKNKLPETETRIKERQTRVETSPQIFEKRKESRLKKEDLVPSTYKYEKSKGWTVVDQRETNKVKRIEKTPLGFLTDRGFNIPNCKSRENTALRIMLGPGEIDYYTDTYSIPLELLALDSTIGNRTDEIYLGVIFPETFEITHLQRALGFSDKQDYRQLSLPQGKMANAENSFYIEMLKFLNGQSYKYYKTELVAWNVWAARAAEEVRVYYADVGRINNRRVIIVMGACTKGNQNDYAGRTGIKYFN